MRISLEKTMQSGNYVGQKWNNVYYTTDTTVVEAVLHAGAIAALEKTIYPDNVAITRQAVSDPATPGSGTSSAVFIGGTRGTGTPDTQLPLFNAVLFHFLVNEGKPAMKFLRLPLDESEVTGGELSTTLTDAISASWASPLTMLGYYCDADGELVTSYSFNHFVQSRQVGWHRRTRPGFKRGWVPV